MPLKVVGLGAGGHALVLLDLLALGGGKVLPVGLLDADPVKRGSRLMGVPILGTDDDLPAARALGAEAFFIGVGRVGASDLPRRLFEWACAQGLAPLDLLHPAATLSPSLVHGPGLIALAGVVVNAGAQLGTGVVLNTGAIVEHEVRVGDHAFIAPRATLLGGVEVGPGAFLGAGCVVRQGVRIGAGALVGAGSVVLKDVPPGGRVRGVPARAFGVEGP